MPLPSTTASSNCPAGPDGVDPSIGSAVVISSACWHVQKKLTAAFTRTQTSGNRVRSRPGATASIRSTLGAHAASTAPASLASASAAPASSLPAPGAQTLTEIECASLPVTLPTQVFGGRGPKPPSAYPVLQDSVSPSGAWTVMVAPRWVRPQCPPSDLASSAEPSMAAPP